MFEMRAKPGGDTDASPTFGVSPMLAKLGELPEGDDWVYEIKWDGVRALARIDRDGRTRTVRLTSRNGNDLTERYPGLEDLGKGIPARKLPLLLDGELVAFGDDGRPDFGLLQSGGAQANFAIFDLLVVGGKEITDLTWEERRERLEQLGISAEHASVPGVYDDGAELLDRMIGRGLEGVVAKRRTGTYLTHKRHSDWTKVKPKPRQEFVIGGWTEGAGRRWGTVGALLLGYFDCRKLNYVGNVGSGFDGADLEELDRLLAPLAISTNPFDDPDLTNAGANFVRPRLVAEIEYSELTAAGHLRHPAYLGLRDDKPARDVTLERKS